MTDRELLKQAAKAYVDKSWHSNPAYMEGFLSSWNPLEDDGDAMRLAVTCGIEFYIEGEGDDEMVWANAICLYTYGNKNSIARRAITLAAASLGEEFYE